MPLSLKVPPSAALGPFSAVDLVAPVMPYNHQSPTRGTPEDQFTSMGSSLSRLFSIGSPDTLTGK